MGASNMKKYTIILFVISFILASCSEILPAKTEYPCRNKDYQFLYQGPDSKLYLYDMCQNTERKITDYGVIWPPLEMWSPDGSFLFVANNGYDGPGSGVIDIEKETFWPTGDAVCANWSTNNVLAYSNAKPYEQFLRPTSQISLFDASKKTTSQISGAVGIWDVQNRLFAISVLQDQEKYLVSDNMIIHDFSKNSVSEKVKLLDSPIEMDVHANLGGLCAVFGRLSKDNQYLATVVTDAVQGNQLQIFNVNSAQNIKVTMPDGKAASSWEISTIRNFKWSPNQSILAFCTSPSNIQYGEGSDEETFDNRLILFSPPDKIVVVREKPCFFSDISWNSDGSKLAFVNYENDIMIISNTGEIILDTSRVTVQGMVAKQKAMGGIWWSPDDKYIATLINSDVCVSRTDLPELNFSCLVEGRSIAWRP